MREPGKIFNERGVPADSGLGNPGASRYFVLYLSQIGWFALGFWLYRNAQWPSTCTPASLLEIYNCSMRLPESGRWLDGAMLTWLWITPILLLLEISRRTGERTT